MALYSRKSNALDSQGLKTWNSWRFVASIMDNEVNPSINSNEITTVIHMVNYHIAINLIHWRSSGEHGGNCQIRQLFTAAIGTNYTVYWLKLTEGCSYAV